MALSLFVPLLPHVKEEVVIAFGTSALVTGVALIVTGFTQGMRQQIAYYQLAIIVQMAGMGFGPAAIAWLRRGKGQPDMVFLMFTVLYAIIMACFLFYTVSQLAGDGPVINCYLDEVPALYGKTSLKIVDGIIVGVSVLIIILSVLMSRWINKRYYSRPGRQNDESERPPSVATVWFEVLLIFIILAVETCLGVLIQYTITEYSKFVNPNDLEVVGEWDFGQIVPLVMLIAPVMELIRALMPRIKHHIRVVRANRPDRIMSINENADTVVDMEKGLRDKEEEGVEDIKGAGVSTETEEVKEEGSKKDSTVTIED